MSCFQHLPWKNQRAETQGLGCGTHPGPAVSLGTAPQQGAPAPLPSADPWRALWPPAQAWQCCETPREAFLKSWGPRWSRKPVSETTLGLLRTGQEYLEGSNFTKFQDNTDATSLGTILWEALR